MRFDYPLLEAAPKVPGKPRHKTRAVVVGGVPIGGDAPIRVQSMTTTDTFDVEGTIAQIHALEEAGCELVRVTVPKPEDAGALSRDQGPHRHPADLRHSLRLQNGPRRPRPPRR